MKSLFNQRVHLRVAKRRQGTRAWYDRKASSSRYDTRIYHAISLVRVVGARRGSFYRLTFGPLCIIFGLRPYGQSKKLRTPKRL